ncbi:MULTISPECIES: hypothetical protein [Okeania]|uniref:hypothetical protein n=1 Tax=Okeania TaxID=1458928 RepID=UPI001374A0E7|nr:MULTISPECIES: hypothetical protein [Okeania]NES91563.1 hypothetical protein [Okeania sp. SIO2B9]NET77397.1 hypothetical protein [Okeania sp. SIO1F9]
MRLLRQPLSILATWVRPVVQQLLQQANIDMRISVILSPCPHATGKEAAIALLVY